LEKYLIYKIEKGDTVESLAVALNITPFEVRGFHNTCCKKEDTIGHDLPPHLTELYISPHIFGLDKLKNLKTKYVPGYDLQLKKDQKKRYGVKIENYDDEDLNNTIHYEIDVVCVFAGDKKFVLELDRKQIYIDNAAPDTLIEQLADQAGKCMFPIQISMNDYGQIGAIENYKQIKKRWLQEKNNLEDYYKGAVAEKIIQNIESVFLDENYLKQSLYKNWFFCLYFAPLYNVYKKNIEAIVQREYPVFGNNSVKYEAVHKAATFLTDTNKVIVDAKGSAIDERTIDEIMNGYNYPKTKMLNGKAKMVESEHEIQYKLHGDDRSIFSIVAAFKTKINESTNKIAKIEIFEL
jgi:hypothetical protein